MYKITSYSKRQAKRLGVEIYPSENPNKKIDVYKKNIKVASIGDVNYLDYPTYLEMERRGQLEPGTAIRRRKAYKKRHKKDSKRKFSPGYYANLILW